MKLYITFVLLLITSKTIGQSILEVNTICDNDVNTHWNASENNSLPLWDHDGNPSTPLLPDERFLNGLNWVSGNTMGNGYSTNNMFFTETNPYGNMTNVKPLTLPNPWYHYLYYGENLSPENGWELLLHNLGRYPDNVTIHSFEENKFTPYIVLYNKYTGVIRVFVTYGRNPTPNDAIDGVKIDLMLALDESDPNSNASGILRLGKGMDQPLDVNTDVKRMSAVAKNPGAENKWYSADFQVTYDPCVCFYPSRLALQFYWFSETDFGLKGRQITMEEDLSSAQNLIETDFLGSFEYSNNSDEASNGFIMYKSLEKALDDYIAQMERYEIQLAAVNAHNAKVKRNKAIAKAFKSIIIAGASATSAGVGGIAISAALNGGAAWASDFVSNAGDLIEKDTVRFYTLEKETKKLLGSQFDFFIDKNFKEKPSPTKPSQPSVAYSEMNFKGKLRNELPIPGPDFLTPGTFKSANPITSLESPLVYKYPIYNDVLGVFSLLETPYIKISNDVHNQYEKNITYKGSYTQVTPYVSVYQSWTNNIQIKLDSDLKYALNSNLDIKDYKINLALVITDSMIEYKNPNLPHSGYQHSFTDPNYITNLTSMNSNINFMERIYSIYDFYNGNEYDTAPYYLLVRFFDEQPVYKKRTRTYQSDFIPKDAFYNTIYEFGVKNERISTPEVELSELDDTIEPEDFGFKSDLYIELKVMVEMEFHTINQYGENNKLTQIFTYVIPKDHYIMENEDIYPNLQNSPLNIGKYSENLTFNHKNFNGEPVEGCNLHSGMYECVAKNNIWIGGDIKTSNGHSVKFMAGNEIYKLPNSNIEGEVTEEIKSIYDYSHPMPQSTAEYVTSFCNGFNGNDPAYKANKPRIGSELTEIENSKKLEDVKIAIFPNPSNGVFTVRSNDDIMELKVYDLLGREINYSTQEISKSEFIVSIESYGLHLLYITTGSGSKTEQILVK